MADLNFFFVSLSDGDASIRVRYIMSHNIQSAKEKIRDDDNSSVHRQAKYYSLVYVIKGSGTVDGIQVTEGQAFFDAPHLKNTARFNKGSIIMQIAFDGVHVKKLLNDIHINISDSVTTVCDIASFDSFLNVYNELKSFYPNFIGQDSTVLLSQITAKSFFYRFLHYIENNSSKNLSTSKRELLVFAEEYMRNNFKNGVTIEDTARHLSIDRRYLYKLFKKHSGISPKQYLNNIKTSFASELLQDTNLSVSEIAVSVGFSDVLQFSSFFKKQTGFSPKKYRNFIHENNQE